MTFIDFLSVFGSSAILSTSLAFFAAKEVVKHSLRVEFDRKLAQLKHQLLLSAQEHQIRFSGLHARIIEGIAGTYELLKKAHWAVADYVSILESSDYPRADRREAVSNAMRDFNEAYYKIKLFLPKAADDQVFNIAMQLREIGQEFAIHCDSPDQGDLDRKKWTDLFKKARDEFGPAFEALEATGREILGTDRLFSTASDSDENC